MQRHHRNNPATLMLLGLPFDVIDRIIACLPTGPPNAVRAFMNTCHAAQDLALPRLLETVSLSHPRNAIGFCRYMLHPVHLAARRPHLRALQVWGLTIEGSVSRAVSAYGLLLAKVLHLSSNLQEFTLFCTDPVLEAQPLIGQSLAACNSLTCLRLDEVGIRAAQLLRQFPHLRQLWITIGDASISIVDVLLPSLHTLERLTLQAGEDLPPQRQDLWPFSSWPAWNRVRSLTIIGSAVWNLRLLVHMFPKLRHLELKDGSETDEAVRQLNRQEGAPWWKELESLKTDLRALRPFPLKNRIRALHLTEGEEAEWLAIVPADGKYSQLCESFLKSLESAGPQVLTCGVDLDLDSRLRALELVCVGASSCRAFRVQLRSGRGQDLMNALRAMVGFFPRLSRLAYLCVEMTLDLAPTPANAVFSQALNQMLGAIEHGAPNLHCFEWCAETPTSPVRRWYWKRETKGAGLVPMSNDIGRIWKACYFKPLKLES